MVDRTELFHSIIASISTGNQNVNVNGGSKSHIVDSNDSKVSTGSGTNYFFGIFKRTNTQTDSVDKQRSAKMEFYKVFFGQAVELVSILKRFYLVKLCLLYLLNVISSVNQDE